MACGPSFLDGSKRFRAESSDVVKPAGKLSLISIQLISFIFILWSSEWHDWDYSIQAIDYLLHIYCTLTGVHRSHCMSRSFASSDTIAHSWKAITMDLPPFMIFITFPLTDLRLWLCNSVDSVDSVDAVMAYTEWKTASGVYHKMWCAEIEVENGLLNSETIPDLVWVCRSWIRLERSVLP